MHRDHSFAGVIEGFQGRVKGDHVTAGGGSEDDVREGDVGEFGVFGLRGWDEVVVLEEGAEGGVVIAVHVGEDPLSYGCFFGGGGGRICG